MADTLVPTGRFSSFEAGTEEAPDRPLGARLLGAGLLWALAVLAGLVALDRRMTAPGELAVDAPAHFPADSSLPAPAGAPLLLLFVHPGCTCSHATLHELERLLADVHAPVTTVVSFVLPVGAPADLLEGSDLLERARALPGVDVRVDRDGVEATRFASATSGQVLLYDERGERRFVGGITPGRGHEGDSAGRESLLALLRGGDHPTSRPSAVYGCELGNEHGSR